MFCVISENKNEWWKLSWPFYQEVGVKCIHLIEPGNQRPQLRENILTIGGVLELVKLANKQKLKSSKVV